MQWFLVIVQLDTKNAFCIQQFRFWKSCRSWDNVAEYGAARQVSDYNILRRNRIACWMTHVTDTHSEFVILFSFHCSSGYAIVRQCYVVLYIASFVRIEVVYGHAVFPHTWYCSVLYWVDDVIVCGLYAKLFVRRYAVFLSFPIFRQRRVLSTIDMFLSDCITKFRSHTNNRQTARIISSTNFNAQFSLFINNMFVTLLSSTWFEH